MVAAASYPGIAVMTGPTDYIGPVALSRMAKPWPAATALCGYGMWPAANRSELHSSVTDVGSVAFSPDGKNPGERK